MKQFPSPVSHRRGTRMAMMTHPVAVALVVAAIHPAGAALKISAGQELIYSGTASWKINGTAGQSQTITGPIRFSALVTEADPAKGYSVVLMRRFQQDGKTSPAQNQSGVELATLHFGPDLARTGVPDRPTGPISMVMQVIRLPFGPRAEVKSGQVWRQTETLPAMPPNPLEVTYTVGGDARVGEKSGVRISKSMAQPLPLKQDLNGRTVTLTDYGETITVDPETGQVLADQLHEKLEMAAGSRKLSLDLATSATLEKSHQLTADELASRVKQAEAIEHLQTGLFTFRPGDEGKKILASAAKEAAAFRGQYANSPYAPALSYLEEVRTQIQAELDRDGRLPGLKGSPAPPFALRSLAGAQQSLAAYRGKIVVISFFASWCGPCNSEAPHLEKEIWRKYRSRGVVVLGIDAGEQSEPEKNARQFRDRHGLTYPVLLDAQNQIMEKYGVTAFPTSLVIDRKGVVRLAEVGFDPAKQTVAATVASLLKSR